MRVRVRIDEARDQRVAAAIDYRLANAGLASPAADGDDPVINNLDPAVERHLPTWGNDQHISDEPAHRVSSLRSPRVAMRSR
jgi:hypothetical protein